VDGAAEFCFAKLGLKIARRVFRQRRGSWHERIKVFKPSGTTNRVKGMNLSETRPTAPGTAEE
jgi:hypothetical protein